MLRLLTLASLAGGALWWALRDRASPASISLPILPSDQGPPPANHGTQGLLSFLFSPVASNSRMVKVEMVMPPGYSGSEEAEAELAEYGMTEAELLTPRVWTLVWLSPDMAWGVVSPPTEQSGKPWPMGTMIDARRKGW